VLGKTFGPWTLGYFLFGVQEFLTMSIDDPEMTVRCLERLKEISFVFGEAQIAAGADVIVFPDHVTGDLVSGEYYEKFLLEIHQEAVETLPVPLIMHICGYTLDRLDTVARSGMAAFHFDSKNDPQKARDIAGDRIGLVGNINNPVTLYSKEPADVRAEVFACLDAGVDMIAPECAIPLATRLENLIEIPRAVAEWSRRNAA
jgi:[methyl-Co(III) methanol-specific corrinoid protein]:coenzyme M methyltransferase